MREYLLDHIKDTATREIIRDLIDENKRLRNPDKEVMKQHVSPAELHIDMAFKKRVKVIGD